MWKSLTQISPLYIQIKQRLDKTNKDPQMYFKSKKNPKTNYLKKEPSPKSLICYPTKATWMLAMSYKAKKKKKKLQANQKELVE